VSGVSWQIISLLRLRRSCIIGRVVYNHSYNHSDITSSDDATWLVRRLSRFVFNGCSLFHRCYSLPLLVPSVLSSAPFVTGLIFSDLTDSQFSCVLCWSDLSSGYLSSNLRPYLNLSVFSLADSFDSILSFFRFSCASTLTDSADLRVPVREHLVE
jgi:hypothetical protein